MPVHQKHDGLDTKNDSPQYRRCQEWEVLGDLHSLFLPSNFTTITSIFISFMEVNACKVIPQNIFEYHSSPQQITYSSSRKSSTNIVMIGIQDLWISCLKLAINLSHKNLSSHAGFLEIEYFEPILSIVDTFFNLRENFLTGTAEVCFLSISLTHTQKFIFDGLLYLLTLLLNLVEAIPNHVQNEALQKLSNIVLKLDNKQTPLESTQTHENFLRYLLAIINRLSSSLLSDLEQTDQLLSRKLCKKHLIAIGGDDLHKNRVESRKQSLITEVNDTKKLPVDDIILCAHVILIFRTVLGQIPNDGSKDSLRHGIQSLLPRSSWWLPKRILMAYLALQDEVKDFLLPNILISFRLTPFESLMFSQ